MRVFFLFLRAPSVLARFCCHDIRTWRRLAKVSCRRRNTHSYSIAKNRGSELILARKYWKLPLLRIFFFRMARVMGPGFKFLCGKPKNATPDSTKCYAYRSEPSSSRSGMHAVTFEVAWLWQSSGGGRGIRVFQGLLGWYNTVHCRRLSCAKSCLLRITRVRDLIKYCPRPYRSLVSLHYRTVRYNVIATVGYVIDTPKEELLRNAIDTPKEETIVFCLQQRTINIMQLSMMIFFWHFSISFVCLVEKRLYKCN